ncbi:MAG TPA: hypothetical protein VG324_19415 [Blastocatellia bacterium]|nr:hypothetical protein [Blastocatellia bacterium]
MQQHQEHAAELLRLIDRVADAHGFTAEERAEAARNALSAQAALEWLPSAGNGAGLDPRRDYAIHVVTVFNSLREGWTTLGGRKLERTLGGWLTPAPT